MKLAPASERVICRIGQVTGTLGVIMAIAIIAIDRTAKFEVISILAFSAWWAIESTATLRRLSSP